LKNNNPIRQVIAESGSVPAIVVSIGTGIYHEPSDLRRVSDEVTHEFSDEVTHEFADWKDPPEFSWPIISPLMRVLGNVTDTEDEHLSFSHVLNAQKIVYYRLNPHIRKKVDLSEYKRIDDLKGYTRDYLALEEIDADLEGIAAFLLRRPPGISGLQSLLSTSADMLSR
jgi:hypothetical protein